MSSWSGRDEKYAEYRCGTCEYCFAAELVSLVQPLPQCPLCAQAVCMVAVLLPAIWVVNQAA